MKISDRKVLVKLRGGLAIAILALAAACSGGHRTASAPSASSHAAGADVQREVTIHAHAATSADGKRSAAEQPRLGGLSLGMSQAGAEAAIGEEPEDSYVLPESGQSVEIREYGGLTVGYDAYGKVVYVEISTPGIASGIPDINVGSSSASAARILSLKEDPASAALTAEVEGGILRLDLDRDAGTIVAMKLVGRALI